MKHRWLLAAAAAVAITAAAEEPTGRSVLTAVDRNMGSDTKVMNAQMVIEGRRGSRTVAFKSWVRGVDESFTEYLEPPREKGVKMLKLGDQLWAYYPATDRTIKISGHMLRQSVMGSDLSYEDLMEDPLLSTIYEPEIAGEEMVGDRPSWVLRLTAARENLAYDSRTLWVDKDRFVILREHRFAKSGKLLKTTDVIEVVEQDGRWIAKEVDFRDALKSDSGGTRFVLDTIEFNGEIPDYVFSKAVLRK